MQLDTSLRTSRTGPEGAIRATLLIGRLCEWCGEWPFPVCIWILIVPTRRIAQLYKNDDMPIKEGNRSVALLRGHK